MANPSWPSTLPGPTSQNLTITPLVDPVITTSMEAGAPKRRRRFTAVPNAVTLMLVLTADQCTTLDTFVATTLQDVLPFDWKDFRTGAAATYVFQKRPSYSLFAAGANLWQAQIQLQQVP